MLTSKEYLQQAEECLQLANASSDVYVKDALTELASDFKAMAKDVHVNEASLGMQRRRRRKTPLCRQLASRRSREDGLQARCKPPFSLVIVFIS
jgi:hypothetical protein